MHLKYKVFETVCRVLLKGGLTGSYVTLRAAVGQDVAHLKKRTLPERFSEIYRTRVWLSGRSSGTLSGMGSELEKTEPVRSHLPDLLARLNTRVLLDLGCGDFNWMRELDLDCQYVGADCVRAVVDRNAAVYGSTNRTFVTLDATSDLLPTADTVLCREVLFHLSFEHIFALIRNVYMSGAAVLIATNDCSTEVNTDIISGDFRILNLNQAPFHFPPPDLSVPDDGLVPGRVLAVWKLSTLFPDAAA